ncbi:MAG TPA: hypothetical protein V6C72_05405 [Chroococcales cyanobacterium]
MKEKYSVRSQLLILAPFACTIAQLGACSQAVFGKEVSEAVSEVLGADHVDPTGFRLMIGCIALLFFLVSTIIGGTVWYMAKGSKKGKSGKEEH